MQFKNNVHLHPADVAHNDLKKRNGNPDFNASDVDNKTLRENLFPFFYKYIKSMAETSNNNLTRNSDVFLSSRGKIDQNSEFTWNNNPHLEAEQKFKLTY